MTTGLELELDLDEKANSLKTKDLAIFNGRCKSLSHKDLRIHNARGRVRGKRFFSGCICL